jgi:hypothetical protein
MAPQTVSDLIGNLKSSLATLQQALAGMPEEAACKCPSDARWTAIECVEHLTIAEEFMLESLRTGEVLAAPIHLPEREARMAAAVAGRARAVLSPEPARPKGRFATLADAMAGFTAARENTIGFVETAPDLRSLQVMHPFLGAISGYELALVMASHAVRHSLQIREIREQIANG